MGDRVSIAFRNDGEDSVVLFHHWGGRELPQVALEYARSLKTEMGGKQTSPLNRMEPAVVMVDFICHLWETGLAKGQEYNANMKRIATGHVVDSLYFGKTPNDGDNSDNGHWIVDIPSLTLIHSKGEFESDEDDAK